jgi:hypothetical protein
MTDDRRPPGQPFVVGGDSMGEGPAGTQRARRFVGWWVLAALWSVPAAAQAIDHPEAQRPDFAVATMTSDWRITVGGSLTTFDTAAAWAPRGLAGAAISLEDTLGLDEQTGTFFLGAAYRFNRRHSLALSVTELGRSATRILDEEVEWGDYIYRAEGEVATDLETTSVRLIWRYDFSDSDRLNAGFLAGLSTFDLGLTLSGEARLESDAGDEWVEGIVEGASVLAPIPVVGFFLDYALSPRWVLRFDAAVIDLSIGSHEGRVLEAGFNLEYVATPWLGLGVGLGGSDLEYRSDEKDEKFGLRYQFNQLGVSACFVF